MPVVRTHQGLSDRDEDLIAARIQAMSQARLAGKPLDQVELPETVAPKEPPAPRKEIKAPMTKLPPLKPPVETKPCETCGKPKAAKRDRCYHCTPGKVPASKAPVPKPTPAPANRPEIPDRSAAAPDNPLIELDAMRSITGQLLELPIPARRRVLAWILDRFPATATETA